MRKLKLQVQTSIDGYMAGPNGEMDFMNFNWSDDLKAFVIALTEPVDGILLGRKLAEGFIPYWTASYNSDTPEPGADKFVHTPKIVFTKTLSQSPWNNTQIATGELSEEINHLKNQSGGDLIAYGGGKFVQSLIKENLVDEINLFINPTAIGKGIPVFPETKSGYTLVQTKAFDCGIVVLTYKPL